MGCLERREKKAMSNSIYFLQDVPENRTPGKLPCHIGTHSHQWTVSMLETILQRENGIKTIDESRTMPVFLFKTTISKAVILEICDLKLEKKR
jgi:hypothetical protein